MGEFPKTLSLVVEQFARVIGSRMKDGLNCNTVSGLCGQGWETFKPFARDLGFGATLRHPSVHSMRETSSFNIVHH